MARVVMALCVTLEAGACAHQAPAVLLVFEDPPGDVRLVHPEAPGIERGTFDLVRLVVTRSAGGPSDTIEVTATFGAAVRPLAPLPVGRAARTTREEPLRIPQTVDLYLDTRAGAGNVPALPGRGFHVPAAQAWDRVLVLSSALDAPPAPGAFLPLHLISSGRTVRAIFPAEAWPEGGFAGALATVSATGGPGAAGGVRPVSRLAGDCQSWDDERCTLPGSGPAILDATAEVPGAGIIELCYPDGRRPEVLPVPVVFQRGPVVTAAPVPAGLVPGALATVLDGDGKPLCTAVVQSVVRDTATLELLGGPEGAAAAHVTFGGADE